MVKQAKTLVAYFSQSGNTEKIAQAIFEELQSLGHEVDLKNISTNFKVDFESYNLVFLGSACHDADVAVPVKKILKKFPKRASFKLAGFVTHSTTMPDGSERNRELFDRWAGKCEGSFETARDIKQIELLGYFNCQGAPIPQIEEFIHNTIVTDDEEWEEYYAEVMLHPNQEDEENVREFTRSVLEKL